MVVRRTFKVGTEGREILVAESHTPDRVYIGIECKENPNRITLTKDEWNEFCGLKYDVRFTAPQGEE